MNYLIIESYTGLKIVPSNWVLSSQCQYYWPPSCQKSQLHNLISMRSDPNEDWCLYRVKKVHGFRDSYASALDAMEEYNRSDSINISENSSVKRKIQEEFIQSDEINDEDVKPSNDKKIKSNQLEKLSSLNQSSPHGSPCTSSTEFSIKNAISKLAQAFEGIREEMSALNKKVDTMIQKRTIDSDDENTLFLENYFPWKNESQMIEAETRIKEDKTQFNLTIKMLKIIGGRDRNGFVVNILKTTMVDDVAILYSWAGKKKKKSFIATFPTFVKVISVVSRYHCHILTDEDIKSVVSRWLKQAKLRINRAELKQEMANDEESSDESS